VGDEPPSRKAVVCHHCGKAWSHSPSLSRTGRVLRIEGTGLLQLQEGGPQDRGLS
jgi:hypothetical protein